MNNFGDQSFAQDIFNKNEAKSNAMANDMEALASLPINTRHGIVLGSIHVLLPSDIICEVSSELPVCRLPNSPDWLSGMTNLRGNIVPVIDLMHLLNLGQGKASKLRLLFFKIEEEWVGIYSSGLPVLMEFLPEDNKAVKANKIAAQLKPFVKGVYYLNKTEWLDFDLKKVFLQLTQNSSTQ